MNSDATTETVDRRKDMASKAQREAVRTRAAKANAAIGSFIKPKSTLANALAAVAATVYAPTAAEAAADALERPYEPEPTTQEWLDSRSIEEIEDATERGVAISEQMAEERLERMAIARDNADFMLSVGKAHGYR